MKHKAFTIIELLVVMAIIAILAALILPAVHKAKERAIQNKVAQPQPGTCLKIIDQRLVDGYPLIVFQDTNTNRRIFYYREAMVVLPEAE